MPISECPSKEQLCRYASGEIDGDAERIENHLEVCSDCRAWVAEASANEQLLAALHHADSRGRHSARVAADTLDVSATPPVPPQPVDGYRIVREVGRGGMGVVYQAQHEATGRMVALKVLLEGPFAGRASRRRFEREVEVAATLDHPNIVTVHDSGLREGRYYFAMDYIDGETLDDYVASHDLSVEQCVGLMLDVCRAVNHAHQRGIIHRDLKPANIRVDADGKPHILDFGLAKMIEPDSQDSLMVSVSHQMIGTFPYMAPEQVAGSSQDIDVRTDVYTLGLILYKILTGHFPYRVVGQIGEIIHSIAEVDPRPPHTFNAAISSDAETIILKALAKEKDRRYQSAGELAADLQRHLAGDAIEARRDSGTYLLKKTLRRHRLGFSFAAGLLVLLVAFAAMMAWLYARSEHNRVLADQHAAHAAEAREDERRERYHTTITLAASYAQQGYYGLIPHLLAGCPEPMRGWEWGYLLAQCPRDLWRTGLGFNAPLACAISADGEWVAVSLWNHDVRVWHVRTGALCLGTSETYGPRVMALHPNGRTLAVDQRTHLLVFDLATGQRVFQSPRIGDTWPDGIAGLWYSSDGAVLYGAVNAGVVYAWDTTTWHLRWTSSAGQGLTAMSADPLEPLLACAYDTGQIAIRSTEDGGLQRSFTIGEENIKRVALADHMLAAVEHGRLHVWDTRADQLVFSITEGLAEITALALSSNGTTVAVGSTNGMVQVYSTLDGSSVATVHHGAPILGVTLLGPDSTVVIVGSDGDVRSRAIVNVKRPQPMIPLECPGASAGGTNVATSSCGDVILGLGFDHTVRIWRTGSWELLAAVTDDAIDSRLLLLRPGSREFAVSVPNAIRFYDLDTQRFLRELPVDGVANIGAFDASGRWLVAAFGGTRGSPAGCRPRLFDLEQGDSVTLKSVLGSDDDDGVFAISPNAQFVAACQWNGTKTYVWDRASGVLLHTLDTHIVSGESLAFHPTFALLAIGDRTGQISLWDVETGKRTGGFSAHIGAVCSVAFSPDGKRLVSAGWDYAVRLWDWQPGEVLLSFRNSHYLPLDVDFSDDGLLLVGSDARPLVWVRRAEPWFDAEPGRPGSPEAGRISQDRAPATSASAGPASLRIQQTSTGDIALEDEDGELKPASEVGTAAKVADEQAPLSEIVQYINENFGTEFTDTDKVEYFAQDMQRRLVDQEGLKQALDPQINQSEENRRLAFNDHFNDVLEDMVDANADIYKKIVDDERFGVVLDHAHSVHMHDTESMQRDIAYRCTSTLVRLRERPNGHGHSFFRID